MHGHTDFGLTTLLFSVPISCLQIWGHDEAWHYVPYKAGALGRSSFRNSTRQAVERG